MQDGIAQAHDIPTRQEVAANATTARLAQAMAKEAAATAASNSNAISALQSTASRHSAAIERILNGLSGGSISFEASFETAEAVTRISEGITALLARVEALETAASVKPEAVTSPEPIASPVVIAAEPQVAVCTKLAALPIPATQITSINLADTTTLRFIILALLAERDGVRGGDKKWHGGKGNFVWPDPKTGEVVEMDVDDFLDLARTQLAAEAGE